MNATREQVLALAKEAHLSAHDAGVSELDRLVHLAQKFERDRLRAQKPDFAILDGESKTHLLHNIPETLE